MAELRWVAPERGDDEAWAELLGAIEIVDQRGETFELDDLADEWDSVWAHPETDSITVWEGDQQVAFGWLKTQVGVVKVHRIDCWGGVRPSHRGRGIGRRLLDWQVQRATEVAAGLDPGLDAQIGLEAGDQQPDLLRLATRAGFRPVRRFLEVARAVSVPLEPVAPPAGVVLEPWTPALDEGARDAHRDAFADHWGSEPRTEEEWRQWYTGHRAYRDDLSVLAVDPADGAVVAFALCAAYPQDWDLVPREAWINSVGTRRGWRGRGVAQWLLTEVLQRVASSATGFERAILGVDADNATGALRLYRRVGFEDVRATTILRRGPLERAPRPPEPASTEIDLTLPRCWWAGDDLTYCAYHDDEWGRPLRDERALFELLCLEGFQAGLSWITILRKRDAFRTAFAGFDVATVAAFEEPDVVRLLADAGIVRHRGKIVATIANARAVLAMHEAGTSLTEVVWSHAPLAREEPLPDRSAVPDSTAESAELARVLRRWGMRYVGPTTVYAFMQSAGLVDDHVAGCHRAGGGDAARRHAPRPEKALPPARKPARKNGSSTGVAPGHAQVEGGHGDGSRPGG